VSAEWLAVPEHRKAGLDRILGALQDRARIVLSTHVNADGDGAGCEAALAAWLVQRGQHVNIVNPTPFPAQYRHLIGDPDWLVELTDVRVGKTLGETDALFVVDTGEPKRIGKVLSGLRSGAPVIVLDHHPPSEPGFKNSVALLDTSACATGELVYDLLVQSDQPWPALCNEGIYTAIVTDTGSFRFSNTTPRAHALAGELIRRGVDPEEAYRRLFATVPLHRIQLLRHALGTLEVDAEAPITSVTVARAIMQETGATTEDLDGLVEHARSIEGTEVALLFRETTDGSTKVSLRSNGVVDVNAIARQFGGGGHIKAAGAVINAPPAKARAQVLAATRAALAGARPTS
jgi:bifunctional oligoribonuclease and PAP phosphatase NrnA